MVSGQKWKTVTAQKVNRIGRSHARCSGATVATNAPMPTSSAASSSTVQPRKTRSGSAWANGARSRASVAG